MMMERCKDNDNSVDELDSLLGEIPRVTSNYQCNSNSSNDHHFNGNGNGIFVMKSGGGVYDEDNLWSRCSYNKSQNVTSPVSGFSVRSDGSYVSLASGGLAVSENGSITPPPGEELRTLWNSGSYGYQGLVHKEELESRNHLNSGFLLGLRRGDCVDKVGLYKRMNNVHIGAEVGNSFCSNGFRALDHLDYGHRQGDAGEFVPLDGVTNEYLDSLSVDSIASRCMFRRQGEMHQALCNYQQKSGLARLLEPTLAHNRPDVGFSQWNNQYRPPNVPWQKSMQQHDQYVKAAGLSRNINPSLRRPPSMNDLRYTRQNVVPYNQGSGMFNGNNFPLENHVGQQFPMGSRVGYGVSTWRARESLNTVIPRGNFEALTTEDSVILQGECSNNKINKEFKISRSQTKGYINGLGSAKRLDKRSQVNGQPQHARNSESSPSAGICNPSLVLPKYNSLAEAQGHIYSLAKDQHGCRFLQNMFVDCTPDDVQMIYNEIIDHVVELTVNPFGNYLIQKLLDACSEDQKMQILHMVTEEPGEVVNISLNTHGTRVVQKLIETLKVKQQIILLMTALEPAFLDLIKDLNGNHVVQRCLEYFSTEDNKFIFCAAAKHCVEIATHQHGCCVLQQCINHSTGQYLHDLVTEISANGLLLAQDRYGNYVVQYVLDMKNPSAISNFITQFEGNYAHLSKQKCSSHVVQRCLYTFEAENRSRVIHELLSSARFEQLLQDPFANYVIKTALEVSQGPLRNILVGAIDPHRAILRNSPYSKKIYSLVWKK